MRFWWSVGASSGSCLICQGGLANKEACDYPHHDNHHHSAATFLRNWRPGGLKLTKRDALSLQSHIGLFQPLFVRCHTNKTVQLQLVPAWKQKTLISGNLSTSQRLASTTPFSLPKCQSAKAARTNGSDSATGDGDRLDFSTELAHYQRQLQRGCAWH